MNEIRWFIKTPDSSLLLYHLNCGPAHLWVFFYWYLIDGGSRVYIKLSSPRTRSFKKTRLLPGSYLHITAFLAFAVRSFVRERGETHAAIYHLDRPSLRLPAIKRCSREYMLHVRVWLTIIVLLLLDGHEICQIDFFFNFFAEVRIMAKTYTFQIVPQNVVHMDSLFIMFTRCRCAVRIVNFPGKNAAEIFITQIWLSFFSITS